MNVIRKTWDRVIRLEQPSRPPKSSIEQLAMSTLETTGNAPFYLLVERIADQLYREELRQGAWILDIGLFGSSLLISSVAQEIEAANGVLWKIERKHKS